MNSHDDLFDDDEFQFRPLRVIRPASIQKKEKEKETDLQQRQQATSSESSSRASRAPMQSEENENETDWQQQEAIAGESTSRGTQQQRRATFTIAPPPSISPSNYSKYIDQNLPENEQLQLLLLWTLRREINEERPKFPHNLTDEIEQPDNETVRQRELHKITHQLVERLSDQDFGSRINDPTLFENRDDRPFLISHPKNEQLREEIRKHKEFIGRLEHDMKERQQALDEVFEYHAKIKDSCPELVDGKINLGSYEDHLDHITDEQRAFYNDWNANSIYDQRPDLTAPLSKLKRDLSSEVTHIRQQVNMANQFQLECGKFIDRLKTAIASRLRRNVLCLPITESDMIDIASEKTQPESSDAQQKGKKRRLIVAREEEDEDYIKRKAKVSLDYFRLLSMLPQKTDTEET